MSLEGLSQEEMVALANKANAEANDPSVSDAENAARKAAASTSGEPKGSMTAEELAAEAEAFQKQKAADEVAQAAEDAAAAGDAAAANADDAEVNPDDADTNADDAAANSDDAANEEAFPTSDDPGLNAALRIMKAAGMKTADLQQHFGEAIATGDAGKVDQEALVKALGEDNATLVMAGVTKWSEDAGKAALEAARQVQESVGGSDNWKKMTAWAKKAAAADPKIKKQIEGITDMLNGSDMSRQLGAQEFKRLYNADTSNATIGGKTIKADAPAAAEKVKPMNATEAYKAKERIHRQRQLGKVSQAEFTKEMARIKAARAAA